MFLFTFILIFYGVLFPHCGNTKFPGSKMMMHVQVRRRHRGKYDKDSRYACIMSIAHGMKPTPGNLLSGVEGRLSHDVFKHLIDATVSSQTARMS